MPHKYIEARRKYHRDYVKRKWAEDGAFKKGIQDWRKDKQRGYWLQHKYGITQEEYQRMYDLQEGACFFCKAKHDRLHVDHDHETKRVRGLLCMNCNTALGRLENLGIDVIIKYLTEEAL